MTDYLVDAYPHPKRSSIVSWQMDSRGRVGQTEALYAPTFCLSPEETDFPAARTALYDDERVAEQYFDESRLFPGGPISRVLRVRPKRHQDIVPVATDLRRVTNTKGFIFYDVDHKIECRWMHANGVYPLAPIHRGREPKHDGSSNRYDLLHPIPELRGLLLEMDVAKSGVRPELGDPFTALRLGSQEWNCSGEDDERAALTEMGNLLFRKDPDVVFTHGGDLWGMEYLLTRIRSYNLQDKVQLGRAADPHQPDVRSRSIHTYGQHLYRSNHWYLRGRQHIDLTKKSLESLPDREDLHGITYLARISNRRIQDVSRNGPGFALQQMQIDEAVNEGCVLPWKRNLSEDWKDAETLTKVDRGGQIHLPPIGVHDDVVAADFSAYYPSIVVGRNLSSDTINCACCPDSPNVIPDLEYHVCIRRRGHQARVLDHIMEHRRHVKAILRNKNRATDHAWAEAIKGELKGIGVVCFGYFRYKNARYGCAEVHQGIQAYGRWGMSEARNAAQERGFRVLHGLTDCIFFQRPGAKDREVFELIREVSNRVEAPMDLEGRYKWVVFLPSRIHKGVSVPTRYYGVFRDGKLKTRGIEVRRRDTPPFVAAVQFEMLNFLAEANNGKEFKARLPGALEIAKTAANALKEFTVNPLDLSIRTTATRSVEEYSGSSRSMVAMRKLREAGLELRPGQAVEYILTRRQGPWDGRVVPLKVAEKEETPVRYDDRAYVELLARSVEGILEPFGWTTERVLAYFST